MSRIEISFSAQLGWNKLIGPRSASFDCSSVPVGNCWVRDANQSCDHLPPHIHRLYRGCCQSSPYGGRSDEAVDPPCEPAGYIMCWGVKFICGKGTITVIFHSRGLKDTSVLFEPQQLWLKSPISKSIATFRQAATACFLLCLCKSSLSHEACWLYVLRQHPDAFMRGLLRWSLNKTEANYV